MKTKVGISRLFVTTFCLFCINLVALADETSLPANWNDYGKLATFANGERNNNADIVLSTVEGRPTYTIYTARGLAWVACVVNNYYDKNKTPFNKDKEYYPSSCNFANCNIQLANDISLAKPSEGVSDNFDADWIPIGENYGSLPPIFSGNFDGKGHTISNLNVLRALEHEVKTAGLIGYANCGSIEDEFLSIKNLNVTGSSVKGLEMVGGIVGYGVNVQISCCSSQIGEISIDNTTSPNIIIRFLGGIAGSLTKGEITNCWSSGKVYCEKLSYGSSYGGGIVGNASESTISDSYSTATVIATGAGGIAGNSGAYTTIKNCLALNTGGIVGYSDRGRIWARDNSEYPVTAADNYASVLVKLYTINTDDEKEVKGIESEAYNGGECTYKKLDALFGSNTSFTFDGTYLPQLNVIIDKTQLEVNTYLGSKNITNSVGDKLIVQKAEILGEEVEIIDNPNDWYKVTGVTLSGATLSNTNGRYTFTMPDNEVTVSGCSSETMDTWEKYGQYAEKDTDYAISEDGKTYTIKTAQGLAWVAYVTNNGRTGEGYPASAGFEDCTVELGNDLSLAQPTGFPVGFASWTPIGTSDKPFLGTFDGKYKAISGLTVTGVESAGLFGYVGNSTSDRKGNISNIGINGANVTGSQYAGALVGRLYGTMERCWSSGSVTAASSGTQTAEAAGGLVGEATDGSTISNCYSTATVTAPLAGGVVGSLIGTLEYCYATGKVISARSATTGGFYNPTYGPAGGICGIVSNVAIINNCLAMNADGITGGTTGRIWGEGSITGSSNYATTKICGTWTSDAAGKDGKDVVYSEYISYVKNNWPSDVWTISNKNLPQLKDTSGQTALPRADYMQVDLVSITITPPSCGRIEVYEDGEKQEPDGENKIAAAIGSTVTIKAIANDDYGFSWLKINDELQQGATVDNYVISNDITISASFYYIIPSVFMYNDVCYERSSNSSEEVMVMKLNNSNYDTGDLDLSEKVIYSNDYGQAEFRLTAIADNAFEGSSALKSVAIPSTISRIGSYAFKDCTGMEKLVVKSPSVQTRSATEPAVPTVGEHAFDDICETAVLYVPEGWKETFKAAPEWSKFLVVKEQQQDGTVLAELTITASSGGTLSVGSITSQNNDTKTLKVAERTDVIVDVAAAEGYILESLTCNGNDVIDQLVDDKLTLSAINGENSIVAVFGIATGIGGTDASAQRVSIKDGRIVVEGVAAGEVISIYNASGHLQHRKVANGEPIEIPMTAGQVYIVKIGKQSFKLMH